MTSSILIAMCVIHASKSAHVGYSKILKRLRKAGISSSDIQSAMNEYFDGKTLLDFMEKLEDAGLFQAEGN